MSQPDPHPQDNCIFCKIAAGKIPSRKVFEDEEIFAFDDINPWAPVHFLMIPKIHIPSMAQVGPEHAGLLGRMMVLAPQLAQARGCNPYPAGGFRIVTNTGAEGGQEVHHLHIHVMGGPRPWLQGLASMLRRCAGRFPQGVASPAGRQSRTGGPCLKINPTTGPFVLSRAQDAPKFIRFQLLR